MPKTMVFTRVFGDFVFSALFAKNTPLRALCLRSGRSGEPLGGCLRGVPGAVPGPQRASWAHPWCDLGPPGGLLGASWGQFGTQKSPWRPLERIRKQWFLSGFLAFSGFVQFYFKKYSFEGAGERSGGFWGRLGSVLGAPGGGSGPPRALLGPS